MPADLPTVPPEMIGMIVDETTFGFRCSLYQYREDLKAWVKMEEFTERRLPDFMMNLAKRIMPK